MVADVTADVVLGWNRPPDPGSGAITGYRVSFAPSAGGVPQTVDVTGPTTTTTTIVGLTPGVEYSFTVAAVNGIGPGPSSNTVVATPFGTVEPPLPTAVGGPGAVLLSWTEPDAGGHPGPLAYVVLFRPLGGSDWTTGPGPISGRVVTVPGLAAGTTYEFGVFAVATDGATSRTLGVATATTDPDAPTPTFTG